MIKLSAFSDEAANDMEGQIAALQRGNIPYTELRSIGGKNVLEFTVAEAKGYRTQFADSGIAVWSVGSPLGKVDISVNLDEYMEKVKHCCALANALHTDKIRTFSFFNAYEEKNKVFDGLNRMTEIAKEYGVFMYHENEKDVYGDTLARVLELQREVPALKCIYDPANYVQVGEKADDTLTALADKADYFHIKDVVAATGELVPAGYGDGKISELIASIRGDKVLTLEPHLALFESYKQIDKVEMKHKFTYENNGEAFDAGVASLKKLLNEAGYKESKEGFVK